MMHLPRLAELVIIYKIKEVLENLGLSSDDYRVISGFPNKEFLTEENVWPTISVEVDSLFGTNVELGSNQWPAVGIVIDIFAKTSGQLDDLSMELWEELNENSYTLYNFNSSFPSVVGDYSGIPSLGSFSVNDFTYNNLPPESFNSIDGMRYHGLFDGWLQLPNVSV